MFIQDEKAPATSTSTFTTEEEPREEVPVVEAGGELTEEERLHAKLKFSGEYDAQPFFKGQAQLFPDTVKVVDVRYRIFDLDKDMDDYSEISRSSAEGGTYKILREDLPQWDAVNARYIIAMKIQKRVFKTIHTSETRPS